ncbi:MAG: hypothetical protein ACM34K_21490 [Bacillota bacterium]
MRNKAYLPRIPYVVFELVKIDLKEQKALGASYEAGQIDTVYLAVMPESYSFKTRGRNSIQQTGEDVFIDKYPNAPERIGISGTFGDMPRLIGGTFLDGYTRLKQFEERIIKMKLESYVLKEEMISKDIDESKAILAVNYYDFLWQKFGSISLNDFDVRCNARENTQLIRYSFDFILVGELINVKADILENDPLLIGLETVLGPAAQSVIDNSVNWLLWQAGYGTKWLGALDVVNVVSSLCSEIKDILGNYKAGAQKEYSNIKTGIQNIGNW